MKDNFFSLIQRAAQLLEIDRNREAIPLLGKAKALEPENGYVRTLLAQAYIGIGNKKEALKHAEEAIALDPDEEWGHRLRSIVLLELERNSDALVSAREAARIDPEDAFVLYTLSTAELAVGHLEEAKAAVDDLVRIYPEMDLSHFAAGNFYLRKGDYRSAEKSFKRALEINPLSSDARNNLAIAIMRKEEASRRPSSIGGLSIVDPDASDPDEVHRHFGEAIKLDPTSEVAQRNFRNQFRYAFPVYLGIALIPFWMMVLFVNPFWAIVWTLIYLYSMVQAVREVRSKRHELIEDLQSILKNLPRLTLQERVEEIANFFSNFASKTWPAHAVALIAVVLRHVDFGGGPPPTYRSTWNKAVASLLILFCAFWMGRLIQKATDD